MAHPTESQHPISSELAGYLVPFILKNVTKRADGCWIRDVLVDPGRGYTRIRRQVDGKRTYYQAHRVMYVAANGPIPTGLTIDHLCEVTACCNPEHLRAMPHRQNVLRSKTNPFAINARKEKCIRGHEFSPHPTNPAWRHCVECARIRQAAFRARKAVAK